MGWAWYACDSTHSVYNNDRKTLHRGRCVVMILENCGQRMEKLLSELKGQIRIQNPQNPHVNYHFGIFVCFFGVLIFRSCPSQDQWETNLKLFWSDRKETSPRFLDLVPIHITLTWKNIYKVYHSEKGNY